MSIFKKVKLTGTDSDQQSVVIGVFLCLEGKLDQEVRIGKYGHCCELA
jgi:hypothetical protein